MEKSVQAPLDIIPVDHVQLLDAIKNDTAEVIVVNFWATWCRPCVAEFPEFVEFNNYLSEKNNIIKDKKAKLFFVTFDFINTLPKTAFPFLEKHEIFGDHFAVNENNNSFIDGMDKKWDGAIPTTMFFFKGKLKKSHLGQLTFEGIKEMTEALVL